MAEATAEIVIRAGRPATIDWRELWAYRELLWILSLRDLLVRYKQTAIGVAWAILRPLLTLLVFTAVFSLIAKLPSDGDAPYALLVFSGLLPWFFFSGAVAGAAGSLVESERMITKVYFPRLVVPLSAVVVAFADFLVASLLLAGLFVWYGFLPDTRAFAVPLFALLALVAALGPGLLFGALNVRFRDVRLVIPFLIQVGLYASPVGYSSALIPEPWRLLYSLNPMVGVIDGFRWSLLAGRAALYLPGFFVSLTVSVLLLVVGVRHFRSTERSFADVI
jgi:lipopolysaccharide transport system permease protein